MQMLTVRNYHLAKGNAGICMFQRFVNVKQSHSVLGHPFIPDPSQRW